MQKITFLLFGLLLFIQQNLIARQQPSLQIKQPTHTQNQVSNPKQFIIGHTCVGCSLTINDAAVKVYTTGSFALEIKLLSADTSFKIISKNEKGKTISKTISYHYRPNAPETPVNTAEIEYINLYPEGNLILSSGDKINIKVKALPNSTVTTSLVSLKELPLSETDGMAGIYSGTYIIKPTDELIKQKLKVTLFTKNNEKVEKESTHYLATLSPLASDMVLTKGSLAHLNYGLGTDRLGGAKIGYLAEGIPLQITGKINDVYKVKLAPNQQAYINEDEVTLLPKGTLPATSLTGSWRVYGDNKYDYVTIGLQTKLPYQSRQLINPSKIEIDIFGATNNTNWITQLTSAKEITNVDYEQVTEKVYRVTLHLKHPMHWGHHIYYDGNNLVIRVKQQPQNLNLNNLTIALDAGHGGANYGASGPSGSSEKMIALSITLKLQKLLQDAGAKVLMTRTREQFVANQQRIIMYRKADPDLLVSIHLNSSGNPFTAAGTSTMYKHVGFRPLSRHIFNRMLELGLKEYGNIGSFNFMLNSPTEFINALVETLFISNLEEEELVVQESFQQKIAEKIFLGIKDFLTEAAAQ